MAWQKRKIQGKLLQAEGVVGDFIISPDMQQLVFGIITLNRSKPRARGALVNYVEHESSLLGVYISFNINYFIYGELIRETAFYVIAN